MWNIDELLNKLDIDFTRLHDLLVYDPHAPMIFSSGIFLWLFAAFIVFYLLLQRRTTARLMFCFLTISTIKAAALISSCLPLLR